ILASSSHRRNCPRRHCHSRSVLRLLGHDGSDRVDGDKLYALLVGSRWDPRNGSRTDRNGGGASLDDFGTAAGCTSRSSRGWALLQAAPNGTAGDWPSYNKTLTSNRFSELSQINRANAEKLKILCTYDSGQYTGFNSGLLEVDGALIFVTAFDIFSINALNCR